MGKKVQNKTMIKKIKEKKDEIGSIKDFKNWEERMTKLQNDMDYLILKAEGLI